ncbi:hypothetical protein [Devosia sp.]|uniref:hypothetical protein n=1 Tax=Devosia sp. TaxID=1871048 RepID=UPI00292E5F0C|nr:hypothetical protein [Devosia sp.]
MKAIELWDIKDQVFLRLSDVLAPLPSRARAAAWEIADFVDPEGVAWFDVGHNGDNGISMLANTGRRVTGNELILLAASSSQIIWGTFRGYDPNDSAEPWIRLHAIDSTFWRCETSDIAARQALLKTFHDVRMVEG